MTQHGAISQLWCRTQNHASMPLFNLLIGLALESVGAAAHTDELTATLQSSKIAVVVAQIQQAAG
jgi:hypothetical protein